MIIALLVAASVSGVPLPPGALNPNVTQSNIENTICVYGWTRTIRPPWQYTSALKRRQIAAMGLSGGMRDYEEDHKIPLELGGAPYDERNLGPEPIEDAHRKDDLEYKLNRMVCSHKMSLRQAQEIMRRLPY